MPSYILGVDPGVTTGLCVIGTERGLEWWLEYRGEVEDVRDGGGLWNLRERLLHLHDQYVLEHVAMEQLMAYVRNAQEKAEAQGVVRMVVYAMEVPLHCYSPTTIRALVVGSGKAKESDIRSVTRNLIGLTRAKKGEGFTPHQQDALVAALTCALKEDYIKVLEVQQPPKLRQPRTEEQE